MPWDFWLIFAALGVLLPLRGLPGGALIIADDLAVDDRAILGRLCGIGRTGSGCGWSGSGCGWSESGCGWSGSGCGRTVVGRSRLERLRPP